MPIKPLTPALSVSPHILPTRVAELAQAGFRSIICNLPDGGAGPGQPGFDQIAAAAKAAGMRAAYLPITPDQIDPAEAAAFTAQLESLPAPEIVFCRSGNRTSLLWVAALA